MFKRSRKRLIACLLTAIFMLTLAFPVPAAVLKGNETKWVKAGSASTKNVKKGSETLSKQIRQISKKTNTKATGGNGPRLKNGVTKQSKPNDPKYAQDRVIVKFKPGLSIKDMGPLAARINLKMTKKLGFTGAQLMKIQNGQSVVEVVQALKQSRAVEYAQPDYIIKPAAAVTDPLYTQEWGLKNTGQSINGAAGTPGIDINVEPAWTKTQGNSDVVVAVIDTGVDINHPDLNNNIWVNTREIPGNGIDDDGDGYVDDVNGWDFWNRENTVFDALDGDEHGTHVSGTIAGSVNGIGIVGVAPNVKIMPLKFIGPGGGYTSDAVLAIDFAKSKGVKLANSSWGGGFYSDVLYDAIKNSGMLFVAAAGNELNDNDLFPAYPASYDLSNILSVTAIDNSGQLAWFSNYGQNSVDIAAPGVDVLSSVPKKPDAGAGLEVTGNNYKAVVQGFGLQEFNSAAARMQIMGKALTSMGVTTSDTILLVQDDQHDIGYSDVLSYYTSALTGYNYTTYNVLTGADGPSFNIMQQYKAVIWFTGSSGGSFRFALTPADQFSLEQYLTSGHNLYLSGPHILYDCDNSYLVNNLLHTVMFYYYEDRTTLNGVAGTAYDGTSYTLDGLGMVWNDRLDTNDPSAVVDLIWAATNYDTSYAYFSGTSMATPHVTGAAALIMSAHPDYSIANVKQVLMATAVPLSSLTGKTVTGGMVNAGDAVVFEPDNDIPGFTFNGGQINGTLDQNTDLDDVFAIHLTKGEKLVAKMSSDTPGTDFDLYLYDKTATTVKSSDGILLYSENLGTSTEEINFIAPSEGTYYLDAYGYSGSGNYALDVQLGAQAGTYENTAAEIGYTGIWNTVNDSNASGGSLASVNAPGSSAEFVFNGIGIRYTALKNPFQGIAKLTLDGTSYLVDLYSGTVQNKAAVFDKTDLLPGTHKLKIEWTGQANRAARKSATTINLDALTVLGPLTKGFYEETNSAVTCTGTWNVFSNTGNSGGTAKYSDTSGAFVTATFSGTTARIGGYKSKYYGIADVYIDNTKVGTIDYYDGTTQFQKILFAKTGLSNSTHTLKIVRTGSKNPLSLGTTINLDFVEIDDALPTTYEENNPNAIYNGSWSDFLNPGNFGGNAKYASTAGASVEFSFRGYSVQLIGYKSKYYGIADVYVDGAKVGSTDYYNSTTLFKQVLFRKDDLANGSHKIKLVLSGSKNPVAVGTSINIDAFVVQAYTP